ncbi:tyrosine-protein phosphatase [Microbacterium sp. NPDC056044]|uniref:tyrosine-protein phosphatase n=1 Tax=Microbacterium sp. NPDC056044 TaxID=3345690 RepID=UPI0035E1BA3A
MAETTGTMTIDGLYNFRDTGGLPLADGGTTRSGVLYRSDALAALTPTGLDALAGTAVGVIVDFRTAEERRSAPDRLPATRPMRTVDLSLIEGALNASAFAALAPGAERPSESDIAAAMAQIPTLGDLYIGMLQHGASTFVDVARLIGDSTDDAPSAVLVHCTAGKDRTGVATALMLDAVGVERDAIVADYAISQQNLSGPWADGMLSMVSSLGVPITATLRTLVTETPPAAIEHALDHLVAEHGGSTAYLRAGGLTDDELERLRLRLAG